MKSLLTLFLVPAVIAALVIPTQAGAPLNGLYIALSTGGPDLEHGRFTESFAGPGQYLTPGNVYYVHSWDGVTAGAQFKFECPELLSAVLQSTDVDGIRTTEVWKKTYSGGTFFLNGTGEAWDGGDATYTGTWDTFEDIVTIEYILGNRIAANSDLNASGTFDTYSLSCMNLIMNGVEVIAGGSPPEYPGLYDLFCAATRVDGFVGNNSTLSMSITDCVVPTEETTWGGIKAQFENE